MWDLEKCYFDKKNISRQQNSMQDNPAWEELGVKIVSIIYSQELIKATDRSSDEKRNLEIALEAMQVSKEGFWLDHFLHCFNYWIWHIIIASPTYF